MSLSVFEYSKVFHVRSVTQGDVIRAEAKDIPRIFQLLYAGEGEARRPGDSADAPPDATDHHGLYLTHSFIHSLTHYALVSDLLIHSFIQLFNHFALL